MRSISFPLIALCAMLPVVSRAQVSTNTPATEIENFELQTDAIIVKGYGDIGSISTEAGTVAVRVKESDNNSANQKEYGISVALESNQSRGFLVVDYGEMEPLIRGLDFLSKISYNITPMPAFDAFVTTKSGLRVGAHTERRQTGIQIFLQFADSERVSLTPDQFSQFQSLINAAKTSLDGLKNKSSLP